MQNTSPDWDALRTIRRSAAFCSVIVLVGVLGFQFVGPPGTTLLDAVYMTAITLTTVGYGEVVDVSTSVSGKMFTTCLLCAGVGTILYFFSALTAFLVEGTVDRMFWRRRMKNNIDALSRHVIVCGGSHTGMNVVAELRDTNRGLVLIEAERETVDGAQERFGKELPCVLGDATDDDVLRYAGIDRASGLVACLGSDKDNLFITLSARQLNPNLRIVARCQDARLIPKLQVAGADAVVSPNRIGGLRLASEIVRPAVVSYLDRMLRAQGERVLRFEEILVSPGSELDGINVAKLRKLRIPDAQLVAMRRMDGTWMDFPQDEDMIRGGHSGVFIASLEAVSELRRLAGQES